MELRKDLNESGGEGFESRHSFSPYNGFANSTRPAPVAWNQSSEEPTERAGKFRSDGVYREAVLRYENRKHRYPHAKSDTQSGHDIDSYTHPEGDPNRNLVRRIEVKGRSTQWDLNEIVEMSDTQFCDALAMRVPADTAGKRPISR